MEMAKPMGTFHFIDGSKVKVFYRGNIKTCARCHKSAANCPGGAIARECLAQGGVKVDLAHHMKTVWELIGFTPTTFVLPTEDKVDSAKFEGDLVVSEKSSFERHIDRPDLKAKCKALIKYNKYHNIPDVFELCAKCSSTDTRILCMLTKVTLKV